MGNMNGATKDTGNIGGFGGAKPMSQEPTMNAHDWVWLGRSTLERSSGMLVPSMGNNKLHNINKNNNNNNQVDDQNNMRIMSNPIYGMDNGNGNMQKQQEACNRNLPPPPINTSTYNVKTNFANGAFAFAKPWKV